MTTTLKTQIQKALKDKPGIIAAYVVGSFASANTSKESDFDLAVVVENKNKTTENDVYNLIRSISFPKDLDLSVVDSSSSPLFLYQIISKGEKIDIGQGKQAVDFEPRVLDNYYDNKHIRDIYYSQLKDKFPKVKR